MIDRMTLSERDADLFLSAVGRLDNMLRAAGYVHDDSQRDILKQHTGRAISVDDILGNAVRHLFTRMERANHFDSVLTALKNGGALIIDAGAPYIPPMDMDGLQPAINDNAKKLEIKTEPRLSWAVEHLRTIGIYADDMIIRVGRIDPTAMRKYPYIVIDIPRINKQIALCEQVGNRTFVSTEILDPSAYERLTKDLLQTLPSITGIRMSPTWGQDICNIIGAENSKARKVKNLEFLEAARKPKPMPLSDEIILQACKEWFAKHNKWPTQNSGLILDGILEGNRWGTVNMALKAGSRGLERGKYNSLPDFLEKYNLKKNRLSIENYLTEDIILQACHEWFAKYGKWPVQDSGLIEDGVLEGNRWGAISMALREGSRGLEKGKYTSLPDFLEKHNLKKNRLSIENYLTEDIILQACKEWFEKHGQWPVQDSGLIEDGILKGNRWSLVSKALREGSRGLEKGKYRGIADFMEKQGLKKNYRSIERHFTEDIILQACHEWFAKHGQWPTRESGLIEDGILKGNTWQSAHNAFRNGGRGLEKGKYTGIADFKKQHGLVYGAMPDTAIDFARAANLDYRPPEKKPAPISQQLPPPTLG